VTGCQGSSCNSHGLAEETLSSGSSRQNSSCFLGISFPTSCSPSNLPRISAKYYKRALRRGNVGLTFENQNIVGLPNVSKHAFSVFGLQVNTAQIRFVNKNVDSIVALESEILRGVLDEVSSKGGRKVEIELRVLPQQNPSVILISRKIPENFRSLWPIR
jgi:hypothetical protein